MEKVLRQAPVYGFTGFQGHDGAIGQGQLLRHGPGFPHQGDGVGVSGQAVKIGAVKAGKGFELVQNAQLFEYVCIQADGTIGRITAGTAAGGFFLVFGMGCGIGAQEEARVATGNRFTQRQLVLVAL